MANFSSSPSANIVSSSLLARIQNSLGQPLPYRCKDVEDMIASNSIKDLSHVLQGLLESIFGFGAEPGWGLDSITKTQQPVEFDSLVQLLAPEGQLLQLVYNLQIDPYITYDFPFGSLPAPTRSTIEEGSLPIFFVNKIQYQSYTKPTVVLIWMSLKVCRVVKGKGLKRGLLQIKLSSVDDAFELYIFYFSHALVSVQWQNKSNSWNNLTDIVYPHLLDNYLGFFLPLNKKGLPNFPQSPTTGVRTPMMQQTPVSIRHSPNSGTQTRSRTRLGLFKASLLSPQKQHSQSSPGTEKMEGDLWWSETFIQILAEFWLNQNSLDSDRGISPQSLNVKTGHQEQLNDFCLQCRSSSKLPQHFI